MHWWLLSLPASGNNHYFLGGLVYMYVMHPLPFCSWKGYARYEPNAESKVATYEHGDYRASKILTPTVIEEALTKWNTQLNRERPFMRPLRGVGSFTSSDCTSNHISLASYTGLNLPISAFLKWKCIPCTQPLRQIPRSAVTLNHSRLAYHPPSLEWHWRTLKASQS